MSVGAQMVVVLKAFVENCVLLVLGHPFEFSWLDVSQTDVSRRFLLVSCDSESRSSSFLGSDLICEHVMESVPGAVATGSLLPTKLSLFTSLTRSLPLPVLTSSLKLGHYPRRECLYKTSGCDRACT